MARASVRTDYRECTACHGRIIWPVDTSGTRLAPVSLGPDPAGTVAVQHTATGTWLGRVIEQGDVGPIFPEKRFRWHRETCQPRASERN